MSEIPLYLSLPCSPVTGLPTAPGAHCCLSGLNGGQPSPSTPSPGVIGVHSHRKLFMWDLNPRLHAWAVRALPSS